MKIALIGYGKMGHEIERILLSRGHEIPLIIDFDTTDRLTAENLAACDVAIEFTTPGTAYENIMTCLKSGMPVVCGTTAWLDRLPEVTALCEAQKGAFFYASNYSIGVNLFFAINRKLAEMMNRFPEYDVTLNEVHHVQKKDAPSGTAITLAEGIIENLHTKNEWVNDIPATAEQIEIHSVREGDVPGIHAVCYESKDDRIELRHTIKNRRTLALGAVIAAEFLCGKHGVYTMDDLLKNN